MRMFFILEVIFVFYMCNFDQSFDKDFLFLIIYLLIFNFESEFEKLLSERKGIK